MTDRVVEAVNNAREVFNIKDFPGDFFTLLEKKESIEKYGILLFKEDIDKLCGFIGYGENGLAVICINFQRPIGRQNFTLAHEIGHWFLHKGQNISDDDQCIYSKNWQEKEASDFAAELLYPKKLFTQDYDNILEEGLLQEDKRKELAEYIDLLCHKYCLSFEMVLRKILSKKRIWKEYNTIHQQIVKALGCNISEYFERDFYVPNAKLAEYQSFKEPYINLEKKIDRLVELGKIGEATAESIKIRNGIDI